MMGGIPRVDISLEMVRETDKAYLMSDGDNNHWIPKSQMQDIEKATVDGKVSIAFTLPEWLAMEKGLI